MKLQIVREKAVTLVKFRLKERLADEGWQLQLSCKANQKQSPQVDRFGQ